jgi:hypothetical protein
VRSVRPLEIVLVLSLAGSVLAVSVPAFLRNLRASRLAEPMEGLAHLGQRATALAAGRDVSRAYPGPAPLTPREVPQGKSVEDSGEIWEHPTWKELGFRIEHAHYFSFAFESQNGDTRSNFIATAHGDLDGDGVTSTFTLRGQVEKGQEPELFPPEIHREVE